MYYGNFECREDILREFAISSFEGEVVQAWYEYEDYDGSAYVIFVHNGMFYLVQGGHCSCHGLEFQWDPEEMTAQALVHMIREGNIWRLGKDQKLVEAIITIDNLIKSGMPENAIGAFLKIRK